MKNQQTLDFVKLPFYKNTIENLENMYILIQLGKACQNFEYSNYSHDLYMVCNHSIVTFEEIKTCPTSK